MTVVGTLVLFATLAVGEVPPPEPPGPEGWGFRAELAKPEPLAPVNLSHVRFVRGKVAGWESYRIDVSPDGQITVISEDAEGERRARYYVEDRLRAGDLTSCVRRPWLRNRISRCFFGPIKRPPFNRDELMDDIDYYPEAYLDRLAREGVNGLWLTVEFDDLVETSFTVRPKDAERRFAKLRKTVDKCLRYGIRTWVFTIEPKARRADDPFVVAHPRMFGPEIANKGGLRPMCTSEPETLQYLTEAARDIFTHVPELGGIINISHGERCTSCLSHLRVLERSPDLRCACGGREPWQVHHGATEALVRGMRSANPKAELITWFYQPQADVGRPEWVYDCAAHLPEGVTFLYNFESGAVVRQAGRWRVAGDYWLSIPGPGIPFREVASRARAAGSRLGAKIQVCTSHEDATVPFVPAPGLLYRKYAEMRKAGIDTVMQCWYFGNYPGVMNKAAGELAFEDFADGEDAFLARLARPVWGDRTDEIRRLWRLYSDAYANYPASTFTQYYGPFHCGVAWPLHPYVRMKPVTRTWHADDPPSGDAIGDSLGDLKLDEMITLVDRMADLPSAGFAAESPAQHQTLNTMKALRLQFESARDIYRFYRLRREAVEASRMRHDAVAAREAVRGMRAIVLREKEISAEMIPLCESDSALGFHSECEAHLFFPEKLVWRIGELDRALAEIDEIDAALVRGEPYPESPFERTAPRCASGETVEGACGTRFRVTRDGSGALSVEGWLPDACGDVTFAAYDATGSEFPAEIRISRDGTLDARWVPQTVPKDCATVKTSPCESGWRFVARIDLRDVAWIYFHSGNDPLWPKRGEPPRHRLYFERVDGTAFGRFIERPFSMECVAHRGWHDAEVPQNTVESIKRAYDAGATWVETDFNAATNGDILCVHCSLALKWISGVDIPVENITAAERATIDLGAVAKTKRPYRIPLIEQVMAVVPANGCLQCEIKRYDDRYADHFDRAVRDAGLDETRITVSSFDLGWLKDFKRRKPSYRTIWLFNAQKEESVDAIIAKAREADVWSICPGCESTRGRISPADADRIRAAGFDFRVYGVHNEEAFRTAVGLKAAGFTSNFYNEAFRWAARAGIRLNPPRATR